VNRLSTQRLLALFGAGVLLFNFPLLALWDRQALLLGVPLFPAALFIVWALLIGALAWIVEGGAEARADPAGTGRPLGSQGPGADPVHHDTP
jgi:hypothetical protein